MPGRSQACGLARVPQVPLMDTRSRLEISAQCLLALDRFEEGLEVALAEALRAVTLDHLEEERRPVLGGLREDLQEVPVLVTVDENAQPPQIVPVLADLTDARNGVLVVRLRGREKDDAVLLQRLDGAHDVLGLQRNVLYPRSAEVLEE